MQVRIDRGAVLVATRGTQPRECRDPKQDPGRGLERHRLNQQASAARNQRTRRRELFGALKEQ
jgi:hypothetical protein